MREKGVTKIVIVIAIIVVIIVASVGVYLFATREAPQKEKLIVGFTGWAETNDWALSFRHFAELYCEDIGLETRYGDPEWNPAVQADILGHFLDVPVDMLVFPAIDMVSARGVVTRAKDAGIPSVCVNADLDSPDVAFSIYMDNYGMAYELGKKAVEMLLEQNGEVSGTVFEALVPLEWAFGEDRRDGFEKAFENYPNVEFVSIESPDSEEVSKERSTSAIGALAEPPICVYAASGGNSYGLQKALGDLGLLYPYGDESHIPFVAFDANLVNLHSLRDKYIDYINMQPVHFYEPLGIYYAKKIVEEGLDCLPEVGTIVTADDVDLGGKTHEGINPWADPMWAPAKVVMRCGHKSLDTVGRLISHDDWDDPTLWYWLLRATE
jgi:ABC-type sugar transport system substrate-binding protein